MDIDFGSLNLICMHVANSVTLTLAMVPVHLDVQQS